MQEADLRSMLSRLAIRPGRTNSRGWIEFPCPLAAWTHANGRDGRASAAARVNPEGVSHFVCKACHQHGKFSKLINLLASYRRDDSIRPMIIEADRADVQSTMSTGFTDFEQVYEPEEITPLVEEQFVGLYDSAWDHPEARAYLESRGVNDFACQILGLMFDQTQRRILFPVRDLAGRLFGFTGRAIDAATQPKIRDYYGLPKRHLILGENLWQHARPTIIVEGLIGFASLISQGIYACANVGALLGSAMTPEKAARIIDFDEPTYLLLDNDQGGDIGLFGTVTPEGGREDNGAIAMLKDHVPLFVPEWPEGKIDPDQITLAEIQHMLANTPLYCGGDNPFDKTWVTWH